MGNVGSSAKRGDLNPNPLLLYVQCDAKSLQRPLSKDGVKMNRSHRIFIRLKDEIDPLRLDR